MHGNLEPEESVFNQHPEMQDVKDGDELLVVNFTKSIPDSDDSPLDIVFTPDDSFRQQLNMHNMLSDQMNKIRESGLFDKEDDDDDDGDIVVRV